MLKNLKQLKAQIMNKEIKIKMEKENYDFSGWATKYGIKCSDGRNILKGAFADSDGQTYPLLWNHDHNDSKKVVGHAVLRNKDEGVYAYCSFNDTEMAKGVKELVKHGDITSLSIYANKLKQNGSDVIHGVIREVSLVLAGANPGARIDNVIAHSEFYDDEGYIEMSDSNFNMCEVQTDLEDTNKENQEELEHACGDDPEKKKELEHANEGENPEKTVADVINSLSDEQKIAVYSLIGQIIEDTAKSNDNMEENNNMKQNAFEENNQEVTNNQELQHSECAFDELKAAAMSAGGSMKAGAARIVKEEKEEMAHSGITNVDYLFPDYKPVKDPSFLKENDGWVARVMAMVGHTPFSRVKSHYLDDTDDAARALGYKKGDPKVEATIAALKRTTGPQTVYVKQKMDRDDMLDITSYDAAGLIKQSMRRKWEKEIARAVLIGDGRDAASDYKIDPLHIRPIWHDDSAYVFNKVLEKGAMTDAEFAKELIREVIRNRKELKGGSGYPVAVMGEDMLSELLLIEDTNGRCIYETEEQLAKKLRVKEIVVCPLFDTAATRSAEGYDYALQLMIVNLADYNIGADKGAQATMFQDFDIDYNKEKFLYEGRCSGALVEPKCALTFELKTVAAE